MADAEPVLAERRDGYLMITLNRPERLNAFNESMHLALRADWKTQRQAPISGLFC